MVGDHWPLSTLFNLRRNFMHLFETKDGDKWVCISCGVEEQKMIEEKGWEWIFDRQDQTLRCSLCGHSDYDFED
jgi:hypothetical protein